MINLDVNEAKKRNLIRLMNEKHLKPVDLARLIERDPAYIATILMPSGEKGSRNIGPKILTVLCEKLGVDESEFYAGMGMPIPERHPQLIPVISWVQAGGFREAVDLYAVGVSGEGEPVQSTKTVSRNAFALRVVGDSMSPRYLPGDIIVVDPAVECVSGCPCVVAMNGEAVFKIFHETKTEIILMPMNPKYPDIVIRKDSPVDFRVVGKVVDLIAKL